MRGRIALFVNNPYCSTDSCFGIIRSLSHEYWIKVFTIEQLTSEFLDDVDLVVFPGGTGSQDAFDILFENKAQIIRDFIDSGGKYLGICMGAYWAGSCFFNLLKDGVDEAQYIARPDTNIKTKGETVATVIWLGETKQMYFFDGTCFTGDKSKFDTIATYKNGDPMAIIQDRVGLIGCHLESEEWWYKKPKLKPFWHKESHFLLLLDFVNKLMEK